MTIANVNVRQILLKRGNTAVSTAYTGPIGEITLDTDLDTIRVHDGVTAGGINILATKATTDALTANAATQSVAIAGLQSNAAVQDLAINTINANITAANLVIASLQSNAAIQAAILDTLTSNAATQSTVLDTLTSNAATQAASLTTLLSNAATQQTSLTDLVANAAAQAQAIASVTGTYSNANVATYLSAFDGNIIPSANVTYSLGSSTNQWKDLWVSNNTIYIGNTPIRVDGGTLLVNGAPVSGGSTYGNANVATYLPTYSGDIAANIVKNGYTWTFGTDGTTILPAGGVIAEGGGITGAIRLTPAGGANANQALLIYPTAAGDGDHVHLTAAGGSTELYLGNDLHYVKLVDGGNVELRATTANLSSQAAWTFDTTGNIDTIQALGIKVPNGVPTNVAVINSTTGSWEANPRSDLATTGGTGSGLTVNVTETGGYASTIAIAEIAGTGYTNGDVITVTSGSSSATFTIVIGGRNTWQFGTDRALTLPSGTSNIQSVQQNGYQSKVTVSPFRILSQARRSQTQSYSSANEDFTSAASDGNGMIAFVGLQGGVAEFITDTMENGGVYERTVRLNGAGPEYGYSSFNDTDDQVFLVTAAPAGAVTEIRFSYTRISKIDIEPDEGVFRIESEPGQDIDIQSGNELRLTATDRVDIDTGTNMRLRAGDGSVQITTNFQVPGATTHQWEFVSGGRLLLPNNTTLKDTVGNAIAFGYEAGLNSQGNEAVAIGVAAGYTGQGNAAVAVGYGAGDTAQGANAIAIGKMAGQTNQAANSIILNATGGELDQITANTFTVAPVRNDVANVAQVMFYNTTSKEVTYGNTINIAGNVTTQYVKVSSGIVSTGASPAPIITGFSSISAENFTFLANGVNILSAIGAYQTFANANAATQATSINTINNTLTSANVGIGLSAGATSQGDSAVAIGSGAGSLNQGLYSVAIGINAGTDSQGARSVAIGSNAGRVNQGEYAVAIGRAAGQNNQANNTIIINATSGTLNQTTANTFTVAPVRNDVANVAQVMFYNTTSKEITYGNTINIAGNISANIVLSSYVISTPVPYASLPNAVSVGAGTRAFINDSGDSTWNGLASGGGAFVVPVFSDGTNWRWG